MKPQNKDITRSKEVIVEDLLAEGQITVKEAVILLEKVLVYTQPPINSAAPPYTPPRESTGLPPMLHRTWTNDPVIFTTDPLLYSK